jgi:hypothetical protein
MDKFIPNHHFHTYTLTHDQIWNAAVFFAVVLCVIGFGGKAFVREEKRLSWVISLFNSGLMSVVGVVYFVQMVSSRYQRALNFSHGGRAAFHSRDNYVVLACLWFALANFADMVFGSIFYFKQLQFLTTWIHHPVFIWIMYSSTTGDASFRRVDPYASFFGMMLVEEIPTFLLALGTVFPSCRTDVGFGATFFLLRIGYHLYFMAAAFYAGVDLVVKCLLILTLLLHTFWFMSWLKSFSRYRAKNASPAKPLFDKAQSEKAQ